MEKEINGVELENLLKDQESSKETTPVTPPGENKVEATKASETERLASEKARERISELLEENKKLKESQNVRNSTELDTFLNSIQDEPSRNLLKTFSDLQKEQLRKEYAPVVEEHNATRFDKEFSQFTEKAPELASYKDEIQKSWLRNPSQSLKALVGETLLDISTSKVKPIERTQSVASRTTPDIADASLDDLYAILESRPPIK